MGSLGGEAARNKAMWVYPKMMGANPSERWGHSACYFNGLVYIFGGCRGGMHFSDVLVCNLMTKTWNILKTTGHGPGPRDSHSAVVVGQRMLVFGGTNGCKKVNDLYILDLLSREWTRPECYGNPPSPRESHTANVVNDDKLVIFGGSGEGDANYLNDLHILDLKCMEWLSPEVRGSIPAPRDSHSSVDVGNRLFVFGGDSGDRYQGDVSVLDMNKLIWSRLDAHGPSPGARAGHAAVSVGTKVYVLGGVGDKQYHNDIWVLDVITYSWVQLDIFSPKCQGRFSHTATVTNLGIAVFGGCGEDERPLNELLILQIDSLSSHKENKLVLTKRANNLVNTTYILVCLYIYIYVYMCACGVCYEPRFLQKETIFVGDTEDLTTQEVEEIMFVPKPSFCYSPDTLHPKRRRTSNSKLRERKPEAEERSVSSASQSDHEHYPSSGVHPLFGQKVPIPRSCYQLSNIPINQTNPKHAYLSLEHPNQIKQQHMNVICPYACRGHCTEAGKSRNLIGAEVHGQIDGAFDSGYLMTATVNGKIFRGVLFAPGPDLVSRGAANVNHANTSVAYYAVEQTRSSADNQASLPLRKDSRVNSELEGVVLTLASPGSDQDRHSPHSQK